MIKKHFILLQQKFKVQVAGRTKALTAVWHFVLISRVSDASSVREGHIWVIGLEPN